MCELISTLKTKQTTKKAQVENEWLNILLKSSQARLLVCWSFGCFVGTFLFAFLGRGLEAGGVCHYVLLTRNPSEQPMQVMTKTCRETVLCKV